MSNIEPKNFTNCDRFVCIFVEGRRSRQEGAVDTTTPS